MLNVVAHKAAPRLQKRIKEPTVLRIQIRTLENILIIRADLLNQFREIAAVYCCGKGKGKVVPTGHVGPEWSRRVKAPNFHDNGTVMVVGCRLYAPAPFTPRSIPDDRKHTWYSFLLEAESTPGP